MLHLVICESAIELIPSQLQGSPDVVASAKTRGKKSSDLLLDRSLHHFALLRLRGAEKRGRPDLVHITALSATNTPLFRDNMMRVYIHTIGDRVIFLGEGVRLPKNYPRFVGLMEKLFKGGGSEDKQESLLRIDNMNFKKLISKIQPSFVVGLSRRGRSMSLNNLSTSLVKERDPVLVIGGFPHGHFSRSVNSCLDELYSIDQHQLEAHTVTARAVYQYEIIMNQKFVR